MCTALADENAFNLCFAAAAGFIGLTIDAEVVLIFAFRVDPINSCSAMCEAIVERSPDCTPESGNFCILQSVCPT